MSTRKAPVHYFHTKKGWIKFDLFPKGTHEGPYGELVVEKSDKDLTDQDQPENSQIYLETCQDQFNKIKELTAYLKRRKWIDKEVKRVDEVCNKKKELKKKKRLKEDEGTGETTSTTSSTELKSFTNSQREEYYDEEWSEVGRLKDENENTRGSTRVSMDPRIRKEWRKITFEGKIPTAAKPGKKSTIELREETKSEELMFIGYQGDDEGDVIEEEHKTEEDVDHEEGIEPFDLKDQTAKSVTYAISSMYDESEGRRESAVPTEIPLRSTVTSLQGVQSQKNIEFIERSSSSSDVSLATKRRTVSSQLARSSKGTDKVESVKKESAKEKVEEEEETSFDQMRKKFKLYSQDEEGYIREVDTGAVDTGMYRLLKKLAAQCVHRRETLAESEVEPQEEKKDVVLDVVEEETELIKCMRELRGKKSTDQDSSGIKEEQIEEATDDETLREDDKWTSLLNVPPEKYTTGWNRIVYMRVLKSILEKKINVKGKEMTIREVLGERKVKELLNMQVKSINLQKRGTTGSRENYEGMDIFLDEMDRDMTQDEEDFLMGKSKTAQKWVELEAFLHRGSDKSLKKRQISNEAKIPTEEAMLDNIEDVLREVTLAEIPGKVTREQFEVNIEVSQVGHKLDLTQSISKSRMGSFEAGDISALQAKSTRSETTPTYHSHHIDDTPQITKMVYKEDNLIDYHNLEGYVKKKLEKHFMVSRKNLTVESKKEISFESVAEEESIDTLEVPATPNAKRFIYPYDFNISLGPVELLTGSKYNGMWNFLGMNNCGFFLTPGGLIIESEMKDGLFQGNGKVYFPNGSTLTGKFVNGHLYSPKYTFADGLEFSHKDWWYLRWPDRRFYSEIVNNEKRHSRKTNDCPARKVPQGCLDMGEGFYSPKTNYIHHPITLEPIRIPSETEREWILLACRKGWDECVSLTKHLHEYIFPVDFNETVYDLEWDDFAFGKESERLRREKNLYQERYEPEPESEPVPPYKSLLDKWIQVERRQKGAQEILDKMANYYKNYKIDILQPLISPEVDDESSSISPQSKEVGLDSERTLPKMTREKQYRKKYRELRELDDEKLRKMFDSNC